MENQRKACNCHDFAPLMSKYMNSGESIKIIDRERYEIAQGHLPNSNRQLTTTDGTLVTLVKDANVGNSVVREGYNSPISLDGLNLKTGEVKLVRLEIDSKTGEAKLVPLEIDERTGEAKLVTLDIDEKTGQAQVVKLEVDEKTGQPKLVGLDITKLTGESKLVLLDVSAKSGSPKLIELKVDDKSGEAKLIPLEVESKDGKSYLVKLDVPELTGESKLIRLEVDSKLGQSKLVELEVSSKDGKVTLVGLEVPDKTGQARLIELHVPNKKGEVQLVRLEVDEKSGKAKLIELDVTHKSADPKLVGLEVDEKLGQVKLVGLDVIKKSSLPKVIELEVTDKLGQSKVIELKVDKKTGEAKVIGLDVTELVGQSKLVELTIDKKVGKAKLVNLDVKTIEGKSKLVKLEIDSKSGEAKLIKLDVEDKIGQAKIVELDVNNKSGEVKLVKLEVPQLDGQVKLIELNVPKLEGEARLIKLEVPELTGQVRLVPLKVDQKLGQSKLITLEVDEKTREPKLIDLKVTPIEGKTKLVALDVNPITGESKLIKLEVPEITGSPKLVMLEVDQLTGEPKLVKLDVEAKSTDPKLIELNVDEKSKDPILVKLEVDEKTGKSILVPLDSSDTRVTNRLNNLDSIDGYSNPIEMPNYTELTGSPKLVMLEVDQLTGEPKLVKLDVTELTGTPKLVMLEVDPIMGQAKLVKLDVPEIIGKAKLVMLEVDPKSGNPKLVMLEVEPKSGEAKLITLDVESKDGQVKLVPLDVPELTGESKLVELQVEEKTGQIKLVPLEVESKDGLVTVVKLELGKTKDGLKTTIKLVVDGKYTKFSSLKFNSKDRYDKATKLLADNIIGEGLNPQMDRKDRALLMKDFSETIELDVEDKFTEFGKLGLKNKSAYKTPLAGVDDANEAEAIGELDKAIDLVENASKVDVFDKMKLKDDYDELINLPDDVVTESVVNHHKVAADIDRSNKDKLREDFSETVDRPDDENINDLSSKYNGVTYIAGTTIPIHHRRADSKVESRSINPMNDEEVVELTPEAVEKYSRTAAWMGIPGKIGLQAAADYESIMDIYDSMNYQLGGGSAAIERMKSYLTAAVSGKGTTVDLPNHILESGHILSGSSIVRMANAGIRSMMGKTGGVMTAAIAGSLSALNGDITGALKSITGTSGGAKAKAIHEALVLVNNLYSRLLGSTETRPDQLPGSSNLGGTTAALLQGDLKGAATSAVSGVVGKLLGVENRDPMNAPKNKKDGLWDESYSENWEDPKSSAGGKRSGILGALDTLGITNGASGSGYGYTSVVDSRSFAFKDRMKTPAMSTTLKELISTDPGSVGCLSKLRDELQSSNSAITTFHHHLKVTDTKDKGIGSVGLDSNHNWEVTLEPLIDKTLNGGFSYIPTIAYMNKWNETEFGIKTNYGRWMPFTSFELQDKKLTSKSLSLFDGGITYPISMEFTNELRLTLVDDQLKTFRRYFDIVAKVSTFDSKSYVDSSSIKEPELNESKPLVSSYKNVTFLCTIYVLNGEYATVKRYPLLVTLADYQIEYTGEVGEGGNDIALHFSIVGEVSQNDLYRITSFHNGMINAAKNSGAMANPNNSLVSAITTKAPEPLQKIFTLGFSS